MLRAYIPPARDLPDKKVGGPWASGSARLGVDTTRNGEACSCRDSDEATLAMLLFFFRLQDFGSLLVGSMPFLSESCRHASTPPPPLFAGGFEPAPGPFPATLGDATQNENARAPPSAPLLRAFF
ncbi:unnamed protein product, partial [Iphiclides podalirius]